MTLIRVDLPAPLSPMSPTISLRPIVRSMSRSACTAPKNFCTASNRTIESKSGVAGVIVSPPRGRRLKQLIIHMILRFAQLTPLGNGPDGRVRRRCAGVSRGAYKGAS